MDIILLSANSPQNGHTKSNNPSAKAIHRVIFNCRYEVLQIFLMQGWKLLFSSEKNNHYRYCDVAEKIKTNFRFQ